MKKRKGFVSNSSSSSFICDITGREFSGWDMGLVDAGMYSCKNNHTFDERFYREPSIQQKREIVLAQDGDYYEEQREKARTLNDAEFEEWWDDDYAEQEFDRGELTPDFCPICSFRYAKPSEIMLFLLAQDNMKLSEVLEKINILYDDWKTFNDKLLRNIKADEFNDLDYKGESH